MVEVDRYVPSGSCYRYFLYLRNIMTLLELYEKLCTGEIKLRNKTHRQRIEEEMMIKNPEFDWFTKVSLAVCIVIAYSIIIGLAALAAGVSNIIR